MIYAFASAPTITIDFVLSLCENIKFQTRYRQLRYNHSSSNYDIQNALSHSTHYIKIAWIMSTLRSKIIYTDVTKAYLLTYIHSYSVEQSPS